jgi:hypothetical protein
MAQAVSHWPLTAAAWARSRVRFYGGKSDNETGVCPSTSVFHCQYLPTNAPYLSSSTCRSYQKDKRAKPGNLPNLRFSSVSIFPPTLHTCLHLHAALTRRTNGRSLGTFQNFGFPLSISFHQCSILVNYMPLLPEGQTDLGTFQKALLFRKLGSIELKSIFT